MQRQARVFIKGFANPHVPRAQVRSIIGQVRPDRQTLLFSATMPTKVERLVSDALTAPVRVTVGAVGAANDDVRQVRAQGCYRVEARVRRCAPVRRHAHCARARHRRRGRRGQRRRAPGV